MEQIVGLDFLPRGDVKNIFLIIFINKKGVVTRRPLEMRLVYCDKKNLPKAYGVFEEIPNK